MTPKRCASITSSATHQLCCKALGLQDLSQGVYDVCMRDKMRCDAIGLGAAPLFLDAVLSGLERERPGWLPAISRSVAFLSCAVSRRFMRSRGATLPSISLSSLTRASLRYCCRNSSSATLPSFAFGLKRSAPANSTHTPFRPTSAAQILLDTHSATPPHR